MRLIIVGACYGENIFYKVLIMMQLKLLAASLALAGSSAVWAVASEPISPIQPAKVTQPALVELGMKLYFDPRLSKSGFISCNSCHNLSMGALTT